MASTFYVDYQKPAIGAAWLNDVNTAVYGNGFVQNATNSVAQPISLKLQESVSVLDFGAIGNGVADDTVAVQKAITYCTSTTRAVQLTVPGLCKITSSLVINRQVDTSLNEFVILGVGRGAGFLVSSAITLFDTTIPVTTDPKSELVTFQNILFESTSAALAAYIISYKFLRMKFVNCVGQKIKVVTSPIYLQSWRFIGCNFRNWSGSNLFDCALEGYDIHSTNSVYEFGSQGFDIHSAKGCSWVGNLFEGSPSGGFLRLQGILGVAVVGNYTEGNAGIDYRFFDGFGGSGIVFSGNRIVATGANVANPNYYSVVWGVGTGACSSGNHTNHNLHDDSLMVAGSLQSIGDSAVDNVHKGSYPIAVMAAGVLPRFSGLSAFAGGGSASATLLPSVINRITTATATNIDSVKLPASSVGAGTYGASISIVNDTAFSIVVFPTGADTINLAASFTMSPFSTKTFLNSNAGRWSVPILAQSDYFVGSLAFDPPSISAGARSSFTITVPGALSGMGATATPVNALPDGIIMMNPGRATTNGVIVDLFNTTAGAIDPPSNTWTARAIP